MKVGDFVDVKIQGLGSFGEGLARVDETEIFVPKSAAGDLLRVKILEFKKGRARASIQEIIEPGPRRQAPPCPHFENCGGCDFQHLPYEDQIAWKVRMARHWVRRSPLENFVKDAQWDQIAAPKPFEYRHRVRFQVKDGQLHFFYPHSHQLLEISQCPILVPGFFDRLSREARLISQAKDWVQSQSQDDLVSDQTPGRYELGDLELEYGPQSFTQGNLEMNQKMWSRIEEDIFTLGKTSAEPRGHALDLFCGIGNFSIPMSVYFETVTGIEASGESIEWARKNAAHNQISNCEFKAQPVETALKDLLTERKRFDWLLLDPPRTGAWESLEAIKKLSPPRLTYVSCSVETLVRDLVQLCKKGPYVIERWTVADLFPQTHHIESIVSLRYRFD